MSFHTDPADVAPCNRNNCRCGDNQNCMYYNSAGPGQSHYNYVAVQGAGAPESPLYRCNYKAYDYYNDADMYDDHAIGCLGGYNETNEGLHGQVDFDDANCSECLYGKRDMCDDCHMDKPDFSGALIPQPPIINLGDGRIFGIDRNVFVMAAAALIAGGYATGRLNLRDRRVQAFIVALAVAYFFF